MDPTTIKSAARKALIAADADYHSWEPERQERFRAAMNESAQDRADAVLLTDLLGIPCNAQNASEIWRDLPLAKLDNLNWAKLLTTGIGEDMIFLNESMAENTTLLDFETLYDYDFDDHLYQEQANKKEFKDYQGRDYYALRFQRWARLIIDEQFHYINLYSLAGYLTDQLEEQGGAVIQSLIPHRYFEGKQHGKPEKSGFLWDVRINAAGLEKQLDELQHRWHQYLQQRWLELSRTFTQVAPAVVTEHIKKNGEQHRNFIFNNEAALKRIRWKHFLVDCRPMTVEFAEVTNMKQQELAKAESWLREAHADIMRNFDPKVVKLKRKRKVVIAPGAFDGLKGKDE